MLKDAKIFLNKIFFFKKFDLEKFLWVFYNFYRLLKKVNHEKNFRQVKRFSAQKTQNWFHLISPRTPRLFSIEKL